jgi:uncharacterized membrane protein
MNRKILGFTFIAVAIVFGWQIALAREPGQITDWYIKNFEAEIQVNKDSSLLITEKITADCGDLPNKHGIFRVVPTRIKTDKGVISNPVELVDITDFNGASYKYQTIKNNSDGTITWKIGDPNRTVRGENDYKIVYKVKNAIRFYDPSFDELYWNLVGAFWQIDIDNFSAKIIFPAEITSQNASVEYYTGYLDSKEKDLAVYQWLDNNTLYFFSTRFLGQGESITASVVFPKNIFIPYQPSFFEKYSGYFAYLFFLLPLGIFIYSYGVWRKYGKDPVMKKPIAPEFEIPEGITPIQMGVVLSSGGWNDKFITATIIDLAVRKLITIKETEGKILFLSYKDYKLEKNIDNYNKANLTEPEKILLDTLFAGGKNEVSLSNLKNSFYKKISLIKNAAINDVVKKNWVVKKSFSLSGNFAGTGLIFLFFLVPAFIWGGWRIFLSIFVSAIILIIFGIIMPERTQQGTDLLFRIKGLELYMKTAENYRQQFYEKENIFDKLLPYAIIFNIATLWVKKMEQIYGKEYFQNYHPVWLAAASSSSFDANSFISQLNGITSSISSGTSSSSGHGGGGGAGGGGGGGGGGGW